MTWQAGARRGKKRPLNITPGRRSKADVPYQLDLDNSSFQIKYNAQQQEDMPEGWGLDMHVTVTHGANYVGFDPTHMTEEEILELRDFWNLFFELVLPVVRHRDE